MENLMDLLLKTCTIIDGSSVNIYNGDVGIIDNHIVRVGSLSEMEFKNVLDCSEKLVIPGFISTNNSTTDRDGELLRLFQGITTELKILTYSELFSDISIRKLPNESLLSSLIGQAMENLVRRKWHVNSILFSDYNGIRYEFLQKRCGLLNEFQISRIRSILSILFDMGIKGIFYQLNFTPHEFIDHNELDMVIDVIKSKNSFLMVELPMIDEKNMEFIEEFLNSILTINYNRIFIHNLKFKTNEIERKVLSHIQTIIKNGTKFITFSPIPLYMDKLINFLPNFLRCNSNKKILKKLKDPLIKLKILSSLRDEMTENDIENTFLYSLPKEFSNYNGRSLKEFWNGSHSKGNIYETILDLLLQGELNIEVIRKKVESPLFGIYFNSSWLIPTIGLSNFIDGDIRIQNLNLKNFISRYKQMVIYKSTKIVAYWGEGDN